MTESATRTGRIVEDRSPTGRDRSRACDRPSERSPRLHADALVIGTWLPALRGAVTVRQGRWLL